MRRDLALQQLSSAIQSSAFAPRTVAARLSEIGDQEREVQEVLFALTEFVPKVQVTPEMIKAAEGKLEEVGGREGVSALSPNSGRIRPVQEPARVPQELPVHQRIRFRRSSGQGL